MIQSLAPLQNTPYFEELISKANDYDSTLAHFAVLLGYSDLLRQLLGWNINISIANVNGFTALHCAYKRGNRACVGLLLEKGASETHLDAPGRAPSHLMPKGFDSGRDHDPGMSSDVQFALEEKLDILSLHPSSSSGYGVSDVDDEKSVNNDERVYQVQSGQMDALASTPKAAVAPRPNH